MALSGWLLCKDGCVIWVFRRYKAVMQSVNIWAGSLTYWIVMILSILCIAIISARNMFSSPCSRLSILRFLSRKRMEPLSGVAAMEGQSSFLK